MIFCFTTISILFTRLSATFFQSEFYPWRCSSMVTKNHVGEHEEQRNKEANEIQIWNWIIYINCHLNSVHSCTSTYKFTTKFSDQKLAIITLFQHLEAQELILYVILDKSEYVIVQKIFWCREKQTCYSYTIFFQLLILFRAFNRMGILFHCSYYPFIKLNIY